MEIRDFLWRGRKSGEIKGDTSDPRELVSLRCGLETLMLKPGEDETIERGRRPRLIPHRGQCGAFDRFQCPKAGSSHFTTRGSLRIRGAHFHPPLEIVDDGVRQFRQTGLDRGHLQGFVRMPYRPNQTASVRLTRNDDDPLRSAFKKILLGIEFEPSLDGLRLGTVTVVAVFGKDWANPVLKESDTRFIASRTGFGTNRSHR